MFAPKTVYIYSICNCLRSLPVAMPPLSSMSTPTVLVPSGVWRASGAVALASASLAWPTGHDQLNANLPGGGWPLGGLTELLLATATSQNNADDRLAGVWRLMLPALSTLARQGRPLVLVSPPGTLHAASLLQAGLALPSVLQVQAGNPSDSVWAAEQAIRGLGATDGGCTGAVVVWLQGPGLGRPDVPPRALRRLQLAALGSACLSVVCRHESARLQPSPAPLRLHVAPASGQRVAVTVLKRRGPPMTQPLYLHLPVAVAPPTRPAVWADEPVSDAVAEMIERLKARALVRDGLRALPEHP